MTEVTDSPVPWVAEHTRRYLETGGDDGHQWRPGVPTLLLTTTGRKSGVKRRTALI
ncbi:MAG: nitroreductase/quinone reductase family protein, partial [Kineosporiaceae bacterium]